MKLIFSGQAWDEYIYWQSRDLKLLARINGLIKACVREGTGKPEPLRGAPSGWRSRRINREHRLVYRPSAEGPLIAQRRYHDWRAGRRGGPPRSQRLSRRNPSHPARIFCAAAAGVLIKTPRQSSAIPSF